MYVRKNIEKTLRNEQRKKMTRIREKSSLELFASNFHQNYQNTDILCSLFISYLPTDS